MAGSEQRARKEKSGGMRIDDHKFFVVAWIKKPLCHVVYI